MSAIDGLLRASQRLLCRPNNHPRGAARAYGSRRRALPGARGRGTRATPISPPVREAGAPPAPDHLLQVTCCPTHPGRARNAVTLAPPTVGGTVAEPRSDLEITGKNRQRHAESNSTSASEATLYPAELVALVCFLPVISRSLLVPQRSPTVGGAG